MSYSASFPIHVRIWFSYFFGFVPMNMHLSKTFKFYDSPHLWHTHLPRLSAPPTPLSTASLLHYGITTPQHYKLFFFFSIQFIYRFYITFSTGCLDPYHK